MTVSRPAELRVGEEIEVDGAAYTVTGLSGTEVRLVDVAGGERSMGLPELLSAPGFRVVTRVAALPPRGLLDGVAPEMVEQARWWEHHIVEVIAGVPPEAGRAARPRPEYDPAVHSLRQRELAKVSELSLDGNELALSTFQRCRLAYEKHGVWGLIDHRSTRKAGARTDERVLAAIDRAVVEQTNQSTGTVTRLRRRVEQILVEEHGVDPASVMPARATFYRLVERISAGKHTFGSARTRRSLAQRPDGQFGTVTALRPGEWTQIDSTPLDVRVVLDNGVVDRVELSWIVDVATRSVPAAVLRPTTKAVDAALLLARSMTPEPMRPGWSDALRMSRSVLPHRRLTDIDQRLEHAAARPVIVPETIVCDHGMVYMSQAFRNACRAMGINLQPAHEGSPWEKGTVETSFSAVGTLFAQYVAGYVGSSVERRGRNAEDSAVWSMVELQQLLDEWLVSTWQNRPHDGLRHPLMPGKALTPNEMYAALVETAGYVPVPLTADDYIELLPAVWRTINAYGVKIRRRTYDCAALTPYRRQHSGVNARKGLWEVHYDPYDVTRIWVRNHYDGGWIQAPWTHLRAGPTPFGEQAWDHARQMLARRGEDPVTEAEIASAAAALLDSAERGPAREKPTKKDKRVAGRTRAVSAAERTPPAPVPGPPPRWDDDDNDEDSGQMADVIPLGVFDAREEAKKWW